MTTNLPCITSEGELGSWCFINICIRILDASYWGSFGLAINYLGWEQTALPNGVSMGFGSGNLFSFHFPASLWSWTCL